MEILVNTVNQNDLHIRLIYTMCVQGISRPERADAEKKSEAES